MTLCDRLIGGAVNLVAKGFDLAAPFWQTPREVEWAKAAADGLAEREAEEEVAEPLSHWKVGDSYCGLCGENITAVSFHACPAEPHYASDAAFRAAYAAEKPRWADLAERLTSAPTPGAESGPAEGSPDKPSAVVDPLSLSLNPMIWTRLPVNRSAEGPFANPAPSAEVEPPASVPSAESPAPEFDWVTAAIPVITGVLAEHRPFSAGRRISGRVCCYAANYAVCGEFADWTDWRSHVAPHIAAALQTRYGATVHDISGDRPRPLSDSPKHRK